MPTYQIIHGDCLEEMRRMIDAGVRVDSIVTDPPYHLSTVKRFGKPGSAPPTSDGATGVYKRAAAGFMGKQWDGGDVAFRPETWGLCYELLKPGGHLVTFGGSRTHHRVWCAVEDAGFEVRDTIMWLYGTGFPKSHDVSKGIDKHGGEQVAWFGPWFRKWREENGVSQKEVAALFPSITGGLTGCVANWELGFNMPTPEQFNTIRKKYNLPFADLTEAEREIVGRNDRPAGWFSSLDGHDITIPATEASREWQGWGTSLKPAHEPILLSRRPLEGTVAGNVLEHGTGAINVDACRVETDEAITNHSRGDESAISKGIYGDSSAQETHQTDGQKLGRWPANVAHDGSEEVLGEFAKYGTSGEKARVLNRGGARQREGWGLSADSKGVVHGDSGTPARFFYCAKASKADRAGSKHPTVKPVALMRWLARMVTPLGGVILDPFAGSGSTGEAAVLEGFDVVMVEADDGYVVDLSARMAAVPGGVRRRTREVQPVAPIRKRTRK